LRQQIAKLGITSIALPPLGAGNGGLDWEKVRPLIEAALGDLSEVDVLVYEPTAAYAGVQKRSGVETLTPAGGLIVELVRRYSVLDLPCSVLEVQKLAYAMERAVVAAGVANPFNLGFVAHKYGPYSDRLRHLLNDLDGSWLTCERRLADARPYDEIRFDWRRQDRLQAWLASVGKPWLAPLQRTTDLIEGFESPLGMELLATLDWLLVEDKVEATVPAVRAALADWAGGHEAAQRKLALFDDRLIRIGLDRLVSHQAA
jgi:hypothetical protein